MTRSLCLISLSVSREYIHKEKERKKKKTILTRQVTRNLDPTSRLDQTHGSADNRSLQNLPSSATTAMSTTPGHEFYSSDVTHTRASSLTITTETVSFTNARGLEGDGVLTTFSPRDRASLERGGESGRGGTEDVPDSVIYDQLSRNPESLSNSNFVSDSLERGMSASSDLDEEESERLDEDSLSDCSLPDWYDPALRWHAPEVVERMRGQGLSVDEEGFWYDPGSFYLDGFEPRGVVFEDEK